MRTDGDINTIINSTELIEVDYGVLLVWLCYSIFFFGCACRIGNGGGGVVCEKTAKSVGFTGYML